MNFLKKIVLTFGLLLLPALAAAQAANPAATAPVAEAKAAAVPAKAADATPGYTPMKPTPGIGMPVEGGIDFQPQVTENGEYAHNINTYVLLPLITVISLVVLLLLFLVVVRFRRSANPEPSKTTHNTLLEVLWTLTPVLILLAVAYPSLDLLARQFKPAPKGALTIKVTGYQWYWGYEYPDNGVSEIVSNMLPEKEEVKPGERYRTDDDGPGHLAADNRLVLPADTPLRMQITAADVIHSFAVPAFWFKLDAVPGRLNEKPLIIKKPGVYFGQCSELCGARHGYMPIAVEVLPKDKFAAWVRAKGGHMPGDAATTAAAAVTPAVNDNKAAVATAPAAAPASADAKK